MPPRSRRPCSYPGCSQLTTERFCEVHKKQERKRHDERRGSSASRGYSFRWQRYRVGFLRANPLCVRCEAVGKLKPSTDVDHIVAVSGPDDPLFWDPSNHQALCHSCHSRKTVMEDGGLGR